MCEISQENDTGRCSVSIILPVYNAEKWLDECLKSVLEQDFDGPLELNIFDDSSTDNSLAIIHHLAPMLTQRGITVVITEGSSNSPKGVGFAKNRAIAKSSGGFLCFLDADDIMMPTRISRQLFLALQNPNAIIGSKFSREPEGSTKRYTNWANGLTESQLTTQAYTSHGPTVIMPTWFCSRNVYDKVGGFSEGGMGTPEDLIFFFRHLELGGSVRRVEEVLIMYRYHLEATTFSVREDTIWDIRVKTFQEHVLNKWKSFSIWNAGKQGRRFYRSLSAGNRGKVIAFCDVDQKKIAKGSYTYQHSPERQKPKVPVVHFSGVTPPIVICVKQDLTNGAFEQNLKSLRLTEGEDYYFFS